MWWTTGSGLVELNITRKQARSAAHQGQCDDDVLALSQEPSIARQLTKLDPERVRLTLKDFGAWGAVELADHPQNLQRLLWIACGDINEGNI